MGGCDRRDAEARAERLLAQVRLGQYVTKAERRAERERREAERDAVPTFETFAAGWLERRLVLGGRKGHLSPSGEADLRWRLAHLNGWFGRMALDTIDEAEVEAFATAKRSTPVRAGGLGPTSTNKVLSTLEAVLGVAVRYRLVDRNVVDGFRVMGEGRPTANLTTAAQIEALLDAAGELDRERRPSRRRRAHGRALIAVLVFGGLRIDEALSLRWRDVDLATGVLRVRAGKTANAARAIEVLPALRDDLAGLKARRGDEPRDALVFATSTGAKDGATNVRRRLLAQAIERANVRLEADDAELVPTNLTPHGLRHTCASLLCALEWHPRRIMGHLGHADAASR